jgi:uncharacterized protein (DUF302 family)
MQPGEGIITKPSKYSAAETLERLEKQIRSRGIQIFARIDHTGEAQKAGLSMPPAEVLIFGNPKAGTPLMLASPTSALDLPLKVLVWQDSSGHVWLSYNDPKYLQARFALSNELIENIAGIERLADAALAES